MPDKLRKLGLLQKQAGTDDYAITAMGVHVLRPWWKRNAQLIGIAFMALIGWALLAIVLSRCRL